MGRVALFLQTRDDARRRGDYGVERAMTVELERLGYVDGNGRVDTVAGPETTAVSMPEQAVPAKKRGRPPRPRCEHGKIVGRCADCEGE